MPLQKVGHWYSNTEPHFPMPVAHDLPWEGKELFLAKLRRVQGKSRSEGYKGWSTCRICKRRNGSYEYRNGQYIWPEGFIHYIRDHNVKPTDEFIKFIMEA